MATLMKWLEQLFEALIWNSRFLVLVAVISSLCASFALFVLATLDVGQLLHSLWQMLGAIGADQRRALHDDMFTYVVKAVDGYLLATFMLMFAFGLYELFISRIDVARESGRGAKILVINSFDELKARLAKVVMMILIVSLFEHVLKLNISTALDVLFTAGAIALVGLALFLSQKAEHRHGGGAGEEHS